MQVELKITEFNDKVEKPDKKNERQKGRLIGKMIKEDGLANDFFTKQERWRTGEKVDKNFIESLIKKVTKGISEEKYK